MRLRFSEKPSEYRRAAVEEASPAIWLDVIERHPEARVWVARNKTIPAQIVSVLASDTDPQVRWAISMKNSLDVDTMAILARDDDEGVRMEIARHKKAPRHILEGLANDSWDKIRAVVADRLAAGE